MEHDDLKFEPIPGLPEKLPKGEVILWQGRPGIWRLAVSALWVNWVIVYFAALAVWRVTVSAQTASIGTALLHAVPLVFFAAVCVGILWLSALIMARTTIYTLTNKRVSLRVGVTVSLNLNLPLVHIESAAVHVQRRGYGTIALRPDDSAQISYVMMWPHVRPWHLRRAEPAMRCIPNAEQVAQVLANAAEIRLSEPVLTQIPNDPIAAE